MLDRFLSDLEKPIAPKSVILYLRLWVLLSGTITLGIMLALALASYWGYVIALGVALPFIIFFFLAIAEFFASIFHLQAEMEKTKNEMLRLRMLNEAFAKGLPLPEFENSPKAEPTFSAPSTSNEPTKPLAQKEEVTKQESIFSYDDENLL